MIIRAFEFGYFLNMGMNRFLGLGEDTMRKEKIEYLRQVT